MCRGDLMDISSCTTTSTSPTASSPVARAWARRSCVEKPARRAECPARAADPRTIRVVERSTIVPACSLSETELREQLARYTRAGRGAEVIEHERRRRVIRVAAEVPESLIRRLIEVERGCCPFFELAWDGKSRRLSVAVPGSDHEPALEAIVSALGA
jgi:hypothetical protein